MKNIPCVQCNVILCARTRVDATQIARDEKEYNQEQNIRKSKDIVEIWRCF